ncbi:MAG: UPF0175 family protein [Lentisphaerae bacterium]|nr:UPF0175 family protein [Lentisphaerota bacterium]
MHTVQLELPDFVDIEPLEVRLIVAAKLYEKGKLSLGQAAQAAGVSKRAFMELAGQYGVSVFNYPAQEVSKDFRNA